MGLYNVIEPCVAGDVQYVRPTAEFQPVFVEDDVAAPLVDEGKLSAYLPGGEPESAEDSEPTDTSEGESPSDPTPSARRRGRRAESDEG